MVVQRCAAVVIVSIQLGSRSLTVKSAAAVQHGSQQHDKDQAIVQSSKLKDVCRAVQCAAEPAPIIYPPLHLLTQCTVPDWCDQPPHSMTCAGRYQAAYRELAKKHPSFRERSETTELIVDISLQVCTP